MVARGASSKDGLGVGGTGLGIPHMPVPVVLKLDLHPTNLVLGGADIWDPLGDEMCWLLLVWGSVANFEESF